LLPHALGLQYEDSPFLWQSLSHLLPLLPPHFPCLLVPAPASTHPAPVPLLTFVPPHLFPLGCLLAHACQGLFVLSASLLPGRTDLTSTCSCLCSFTLVCTCLCLFGFCLHSFVLVQPLACACIKYMVSGEQTHLYIINYLPV
jgi:hypothetical protein